MPSSHVLPLFSEILRYRESLLGWEESCRAAAKESFVRLREFLAPPGEDRPDRPEGTHRALPDLHPPLQGRLSPLCETLLSRLRDVGILIAESRALWHRER